LNTIVVKYSFEKLSQLSGMSLNLCCNIATNDVTRTWHKKIVELDDGHPITKHHVKYETRTWWERRNYDTIWMSKSHEWWSLLARSLRTKCRVKFLDSNNFFCFEDLWVKIESLILETGLFLGWTSRYYKISLNTQKMQ